MSEQEYQRAATDAPAETKEVAPVAPVSVANDVSNNIELISHRGSDYFLDYEKRRIASHRFKVSLILGLIIITFMCIVCLALSVKQYHKQYANKSCGAVLLSLSNMTAAIAAEGIASLNYVMDVDAVLYQPDRVVTRPMLQQQAYTRSILLQAAEDSKACGGSSNLFSLLNIGNVLSLQNNVLRRSITPLELMDEFRSRLLSATGALAHYVGIGVGSGVASMIWYGQLLRAIRALGTSGLGIRLAEINPSIRDKTFVSSSVCLAAVDLSTALSQVTNEFSSTMRTDYLETIEVPISIVETVLDSVEANLTDLKAGGGLSAAETLDSLMNAIQVTLQGLADAREWSKASFGTWDACMWFYPAIAVLCIVVIVMTVRDIIVAVFTAQAEVIDIYNTSRLEGSMARMEYFMDRVYHMDADGVREIVEISANYPMTTAVERNVLKLEAPVLQVLSYVNPCIMGRRLESLRSDTDSLLHESILQGNQQESLVEDGDLVGQLSLMDDGHWDAEEKSSGKELMLSGLYNSHACLLLIDFSLFCADISAERFKTIPGELKTLYKEIAELVNRFHGHVLGTSGSVLIAGWNACGGAFVDQPENSVGFLLLKLQDEVLQRKRLLQCAVVSGTIPQGVVGSGTLQTFVMEGSLLRMGRYLLQIARDHDTSFVVDFSTFLRLDTRQFYKRALQKVALDSRCKGVPGNETVVFELLPTSSEVSQQNVLLWNEAFDNFHTGHIEEAKVKLRRWERLYGSTPSWNSLMMCIGERPPRTITYLYTDTEEGFDVSMVL